MDQDKFPGNSKMPATRNTNSKGEGRKPLEKIVTEDVEYKKKSIGAKLKGLFLAADFKTTTGYIFREVMLPATRNMMHDAVTKSAERVFYGERVSRTPIRNNTRYGSVQYTGESRRRGNVIDMDTRRRPEYQRNTRTAGISEILMGNHNDASMVLERMHDIIENHEFVSVADFNELCGLPVSSVSHNVGWYSLRGAEIHNSREGYILSLPAVEDRA